MILCSMYQVFGAMAQLVARFHGMEEVTGSNPVSSTARSGRSVKARFLETVAT